MGKMDSVQKQLKEQEMIRDFNQGIIKDLQSQQIIMSDKIKSYKNNDDIEQNKLDKLKVQNLTYEDLLEKNISNKYTVQQTLKNLEENKNEQLTSKQAENNSKLFSRLNNSQDLQSSITAK